MSEMESILGSIAKLRRQPENALINQVIRKVHEKPSRFIVEEPSPTPLTTQRLVQKSVPSKIGLPEFLKLKPPSFTSSKGTKSPLYFLDEVEKRLRVLR